MEIDKTHKAHNKLEEYGDEHIASFNAPVPTFLKFNYVLWIVFGIVWFFMFWNGSTVAFFDRGYWFELQKAANTTFPFINVVEQTQTTNNQETAQRIHE